MKLYVQDFGTIAGTDPVVPTGCLAIDPVSGQAKIGRNSLAWSALPVLGAQVPIPVIASLANIPPATVEGTPFIVKGAVQAAQFWRRNLAKDPKATSLASFVGSPAAGALSLITSWRTTAVRFTRSATGAARFNYGAPSLAVSTIHSFRCKIQTSSDITLTVIYRPVGTTNSTGQVVFGTVLCTTGETELVLNNIALASNGNSGGSFAFTWSEGAVSQTVDITDIQIEQAADTVASFNGGTTDVAPYDYAWDGTANNSATTATRTPYAGALYLA